MMAMSADAALSAASHIDVRNVIERLGTSSRVFSDEERCGVVFIASAIAELIDKKCVTVFGAARREESPLLVVYMSDGWGAEVTRTHTMRMGDQTIRRSGTFRAEFLAEKVLVKSIDSSGSIVAAIRLKPPRLMTSKGGVDIFRASLSECFGRLEVPDNIVVTVYLQDGLHAASFTRRHRSRHEVFYDLLEGELPPEVIISRRARDWVFSAVAFTSLPAQ